MSAARLLLQVTVGLSPTMPTPAKCRQWSYTSDDYERDKGQGMVDLIHLTEQARDYAHSQMDPRTNNYVRLEWTWL